MSERYVTAGPICLPGRTAGAAALFALVMLSAPIAANARHAALPADTGGTSAGLAGVTLTPGVGTATGTNGPTTTAMESSFGASAAVGHSVVFVSEPAGFMYPDRVHIYARGISDQWVRIASVSAPDAMVGDRFGQGIAASGDDLLAGMPSANGGAGAVVVVRRTAAGAWSDVEHLPAQTGTGDAFGSALAADSRTVLAAAPGRGGGRGAVIRFERSARGDWVQAEVWAPEGLPDKAGFGASIVLHGDFAAVAAPSAGVVLVYRRDPFTGNWSESGRLGHPDGTAGPYGHVLGLAVSNSGRPTLAVGSPRASGLAGAVDLFDHADGVWTHTINLSPDEADSRALFGAALAWSADELWVGAPGRNGFSGGVERFRRTKGLWVSAGTWTPVEGHSGDQAGSSLAAGPQFAVVSAPRSDYGEGVSYVVEQHGSEWRTAARLFSTEPVPPTMTGGQIDCAGGSAGAFECKDVDMLSFLSLPDMGVTRRGVRLNDVWGWTDEESGKEYAIVGSMEATAFIDISDPFNPLYLGSLDRTEGSPGASWRDIKVYRDHAYIVADGSGTHGMQVFDLRQLRDVTSPPVDFEPTTFYDRVASVHNIVINEETGYAYAVGSNSGGETCGGGLHMISLRDPATPEFAGCFSHADTGRSGTGYSHDAQCVIYAGPDAAYQGREICIGANETAISVSDVTDKEAPVAISSATYPDYSYVHQGWLTEDHRTFYQNDELDELQGRAEKTRTLVWDVTDLDDPILVTEFFGDASSTDHNLYVKGDLMYQTNNASGLRIIDISDRAAPVEVGYFDTTPYGANVAGFNGTWSSYPYFESGVIVVSSRREGVFLLKKRDLDL